MIHHVDRGFAILDPDVHVQPENQVRARDQLHVFDDNFVACVGMNFLRAPVGKRMGRDRCHAQPVFVGQP